MIKRLVITEDWGCSKQLIKNKRASSVIYFQNISNFEKGDVLLLEGGKDIDPAYYNEDIGKNTDFPNKRDTLERSAFERAMEFSIPMIGICRGAQLITAGLGGKVIQDVSGHHGTHKVTTSDGKSFNVSSVHHQMCAPLFTKCELLAWASPSKSKYYLNGDNKECDYLKSVGYREPEIIWYPEAKALCIQGHPEYCSDESLFVQYYFNLIEKYFYKECN